MTTTQNTTSASPKKQTKAERIAALHAANLARKAELANGTSTPKAELRAEADKATAEFAKRPHKNRGFKQMPATTGLKPAQGSEALFTVSIDREESAPMSLDKCEEAAHGSMDAAEAIAIHAYPSGKLHRAVKATSGKGGKASKPTKPAKSAPKAKSAKPAKPAAKPAKDSTASDTMPDKVLELARREQGATPAELNALTNWKGAPWKWLFSNPKSTGWCDRRGLKFRVIKREAEEGKRAQTAYKVG